MVRYWLGPLYLYNLPFNHTAVMVRIRSIFQLILAVEFMAFYFTKTHILL